MTRIESMLERLPSVKRQQVEAFAEELLRREMDASEATRDTRVNNIQFDKLEGMLKSDGPTLDERDEKRASINAWADAAED
jgi:hypothetical protein